MFRNKSPCPSEPSQYPDNDCIQHHRTFVRFAFLPESSDSGATLLVAGTTVQSTQAGGEFLIARSRLEPALRSLGIDPSGPPHFFEILIRLNNFVGGAILPEIVAGRTRKAPE